MGLRKEVFLSILVILAIVPFASAGFFSIFTGEVTNAQTEVNASIVSNSAPIIQRVTFTSTLDLTEGAQTTKEFNLSVFDLDGALDINHTNAFVNVTLANCNGESRNRNAVCTNTTAAAGQANHINFTCSVTFQYYDCASSWTVNASVQDKFSTPSRTLNDTTALTVNTLNSVDIFPLAVGFGNLNSGDTNRSSTQNNTVNNTGNSAPLFIDLNSTNLKGETLTGFQYNASNFSSISSNATDLNNPCVLSVGALANYTFFNVSTSSLGAFPPQVQKDTKHNGDFITVRYCSRGVPTLPRQNYTTVSEGKWTLRANF